MELSIVDLKDKFEQPLSVDAAVSTLSGKAGASMLVAGGSWVMRAPLRDEETDCVFVSLAKIPELHRISVTDTSFELGALVTHDRLAIAATHLPEMAALVQAAGQSANPAIRRVATVGGNICTQGFAAADLVPAFVAMEGSVEVQSADGTARLKIGDFIQTRASRPSEEILTNVSIPRQAGRSAHARGLLRRAGEYPVANVSVYLELDGDGVIGVARVSVGAVEALPKRWHSLEQALSGKELSKASIADIAQSLMADFTPRDDVDAPGWYRRRILPRLVERAFADVVGQMEEST